MKNKGILAVLKEKGAKIHCAQTIEIGPEVDPDRIEGRGLTIYPGCRIYGADTVILAGAELGAEGPVTIRNCFIGKDVKLKSGTFEGSCFLDQSSIGPGGQVRAGCLIEEGARGAHTVALKQTILFPYVTLGSLINFCDCLMAGGTDEKNHSEVGSSYIHFNYTPNQDKATASLIGDVPRGVMLKEPPVFLGGQGGIVGPVRIAYGVVVAAGTIVRKDLAEEDKMLLGTGTLSRTVPFHQGLYTNIGRIIEMNSLYIANLIALRRWYRDVRGLFFRDGNLERKFFEGALQVIDSAISERVKRLGEVAERIPRSIEIYRRVKGIPKGEDTTIVRKLHFYENWERVKEVFELSKEGQGDQGRRVRFMEIIEQKIGEKGKDYISVIKGLNQEEASLGTEWLQGIVDGVVEQVWRCLPEYGRKRG